jgi:hypothetical protein
MRFAVVAGTLFPFPSVVNPDGSLKVIGYAADLYEPTSLFSAESFGMGAIYMREVQYPDHTGIQKTLN